MQESSKLSLFLSIPTVIAFLQVLYLPHFGGVDGFTNLISYLQFRSYLFLAVFCGVAIGTILIIAVFRPSTWFPALFGATICCAVLNIVYVWSAVPNVAALNWILYTETEDGVIYYNTTAEIWLAITLGFLVCMIGFVQGLTSQENLRRRFLNAFLTAGLFGSLALLPLPVDIYLLDHGDFERHVTNLFAQNFTNADLLFATFTTFTVCAILMLLAKSKIPGIYGFDKAK